MSCIQDDYLFFGTACTGQPDILFGASGGIPCRRHGHCNGGKYGSSPFEQLGRFCTFHKNHLIS